MNTKICALVAASVSSVAMAQSASVSVNAPAMAAPGDMVTVTILADFDVSSGTDGIFGKGLYGFGGSATAAGPGTASANAIDAAFPSLQAPGTNSGAGAALVGGGVGTGAPVAASPASLFTYMIEIPGDASGQIDLSYDGAVVLDVNGTLETYSTNPGANQNMLTVTGATITIGSAGGCNRADLAEPFNVLNASDINAFVAAFLGGMADLNGDSVTNSSDINAFVADFLGGCP